MLASNDPACSYTFWSLSQKGKPKSAQGNPHRHNNKHSLLHHKSNERLLRVTPPQRQVKETLTDFSLAESSNMCSSGFFAGSLPSTNTCSSTHARTHTHRTESCQSCEWRRTRWDQTDERRCHRTWLMDGCPLLFLLETVSRPHREEKRLRRLLKVRGAAWLRFLMLLSVRADTCDGGETRR